MDYTCRNDSVYATQYTDFFLILNNSCYQEKVDGDDDMNNDEERESDHKHNLVDDQNVADL